MESFHNTANVKKFEFLLWMSWTENKKFVDSLQQCFAFTYQAKIQMLTAICSIVKLIPWNLINLSHLLKVELLCRYICTSKYLLPWNMTYILLHTSQVLWARMYARCKAKCQSSFYIPTVWTVKVALLKMTKWSKSIVSTTSIMERQLFCQKFVK